MSTHSANPVVPPVLLSAPLKPVSIASSIIPYPRDDERAKYLSYRSCGFSVREALHLTNRSQAVLSVWRHDDIFNDLEQRVPEFRRELGKEYIEIEFYRNFRLALEKDYRVLSKSLSDVPMTSMEHEYLLKCSSQYTPQQLQAIESVLESIDSGFNFAEFVSANPDIIELSRTDTVRIQKGSK